MFGEYVAFRVKVQGTTKKPLLLGKHGRRVGNTEAEIGPGRTCRPVDTTDTSTLTPSELGSQGELWADD